MNDDKRKSASTLVHKVGELTMLTEPVGAYKYQSRSKWQGIFCFN